MNIEHWGFNDLKHEGFRATLPKPFSAHVAVGAAPNARRYSCRHSCRHSCRRLTDNQWQANGCVTDGRIDSATDSRRQCVLQRMIQQTQAQTAELWLWHEPNHLAIFDTHTKPYWLRFNTIGATARSSASCIDIDIAVGNSQTPLLIRLRLVFILLYSTTFEAFLFLFNAFPLLFIFCDSFLIKMKINCRNKGLNCSWVHF